VLRLDDTVYCFYVLPWLNAPKGVRFGSVTVAPLEEAIAENDPRLETIARIMSIYQGLGSTQSVC
jgi:hypothetical protein